MLKIRKNYGLYILIFPTILYYVIFHYYPMYGVQIAFKDFIFVKGITGSPWVGFTHFERFFRSFQFWTLIRNTLGLSLYQLAAGFPAPIILALLLNYATNHKYKRLVQTITYAPHFISTVVLVGIVYIFLSPRTGIINNVIKLLGGEPVFFLAKPQWFKTLYVVSGIWQNCGWNAIIYLSALAGISPELHDSGIVDGANKLQRIWHIDLPGIMPTAIILLIMNLGKVMDVGFEKAYLMQNSLNIDY